jgi:hypothetical protein
MDTERETQMVGNHMISRIRNQLTPANVMSAIALFIALGGVAYATTLAPANSVNSRAIIAKNVHRSDANNDFTFGSGGAIFENGGFVNDGATATLAGNSRAALKYTCSATPSLTYQNKQTSFDKDLWIDEGGNVSHYVVNGGTSKNLPVANTTHASIQIIGGAADGVNRVTTMQFSGFRNLNGTCYVAFWTELGPNFRGA